jgi:transposase
VLAELCRRDLVPAVWVASLEDRAIRERLRRRAHLVKLRTSHRNRIFGLLTQFGLRISFTRLRRPDAIELLERRGVPAVWRHSIAEHLDQIDELQRRIGPIDRELAPIARSDARAQLLQTVPGVGPLIGLTFASEIGDVSRFSSAAKLVGYAGLAPRIIQSGERSATGACQRRARGRFAGPRSRPLTKPGGRLIHSTSTTADSLRTTAPTRQRSRSPAKLLICSWQMLSRGQVFRPTRSTSAAASSRCFQPA